jgi:hypothetical protein
MSQLVVPQVHTGRRWPVYRQALVGGVNGLVLTALVVALAACTRDSPDPTADPACSQLPVGVVRSVVADLGSPPSTQGRAPADAPEFGNLNASERLSITYRCDWPSATDLKQDAVSVLVRDYDPGELPLLEKGLGEDKRAPLTTSIPGHGRAWNDNGHGRSAWICSTRHTDVQLLTLTIGTARNSDDPAGAAKALAEAIVPRIGCQSDPSPTTAQSSPTPSH